MRTQSVGLGLLVGMLGVVGSASSAHADTTQGACDAASLTCSTGTAALSAKITQTLPTVIDSGDMSAGPLKVRTKFTIDPVKTGGDPLLAVDMPKGAIVKATWNEKGYVNVSAVTDATATGSIKSHYTLTPSLQGTIYGVSVNYDATSLVNKVQGAAFHYDAQSQAALMPWGFTPTTLKGTPPALDQSTIFSIPFEQLGVADYIAEGTLSIQASANPTFTYSTKSLRLDSETIKTVDGVAKLAVGDDDALDLSAQVTGEIVLGGTMDIKPVVNVTTVDGYPTFGLVKYSFSAVSPKIGSDTPVPVNFGVTTIHVPLPNVKVPSATLGMGNLESGNSVKEKVTIENTGELGGKFTVTSSDPRFTVASGEQKVDAKSRTALEITFTPTDNAPATATITVKSNDPSDPEQTFDVAANGAKGSDTSSSSDGDDGTASDASESSGCSMSSHGSTSGLGALGVGLGLVALARRRRSSRRA